MPQYDHFSDILQLLSDLDEAANKLCGITDLKPASRISLDDLKLMGGAVAHLEATNRSPA